MGILDFNKPIYFEVPIPIATKKRTYHYKDADDFSCESIVQIILHSDGSHTLTCKNGDSHLIHPTWTSITIEEENGQIYTQNLEGEIL